MSWPWRGWNITYLSFIKWSDRKEEPGNHDVSIHRQSMKWSNQDAYTTGLAACLSPGQDFLNVDREY